MSDPSAREAAVQALATVLRTTNACVEHDDGTVADIPPLGLILFAEGDAQVATLLSPLQYDVELSVVLQVHVTQADELDRDTAMDALLQAIAAAIIADRTLGAAVDFTEIGSPTFRTSEISGAAKAAELPITLSFLAPGSPLG